MKPVKDDGYKIKEAILAKDWDKIDNVSNGTPKYRYRH